MSDIDRRLAAVARRQRMLMTAEDVHAVGGRQDHVHNRLAGGRWQRVDHGVYLLAGAPFDWPARQLAACLGAGDDALTSHFAAARVWGLPGYGRATLELSIPRGRRYRRRGVRSHESSDLDRCRAMVRDGIPVTDPDRTLLDVARFVGVERLARAVEAARRNDLVTWASLIGCLQAHARRGRPGIRRLRAVILTGADRDEITDSDIELLVLGLLAGSDLPEPVLHHRVHDGDRFVAEVDMAYPAWKIAIECDGAVHLWDEVRQRDLPRQNDLVLLGWTVLRFTKERVMTRPDAVVREVRDAIAASRSLRTGGTFV